MEDWKQCEAKYVYAPTPLECEYRSVSCMRCLLERFCD